jgi:hypothetical protein
MTHIQTNLYICDINCRSKTEEPKPHAESTGHGASESTKEGTKVDTYRFLFVFYADSFCLT